MSIMEPSCGNQQRSLFRIPHRWSRVLDPWIRMTMPWSTSGGLKLDWLAVDEKGIPVLICVHKKVKLFSHR